MTRRPAMANPTAYLLATLGSTVIAVPALPLLCLPAVRKRWARWHARRVAVLLGNPTMKQTGRIGHYVRWLLLHVATGLPAGLFALFVVGNLLVAVVVAPLWWLFPETDPPRLFIEVPVTGWASAILLGVAQVTLLAGVAYRAFPPLARAHARLSERSLAPSASERLLSRVADLARTRADVLDAHGAELRRIERDLHDGAQARLVGVAMRLAMAKQVIARVGRSGSAGGPGQPDTLEMVARLISEAHEGAEEAITELRTVIRNTYPPILADQGLAGALVAVAARSGLPTTVDVGALGRVPAAVESVAYFAVAEALSNVTKHSGATKAGVRAWRIGSLLRVAVTDDGSGGADESRGTGLDGIRRRAGALDGSLTVRSPQGGPTEITLEVPCSVAW